MSETPAWQPPTGHVPVPAQLPPESGAPLPPPSPYPAMPEYQAPLTSQVTPPYPTVTAPAPPSPTRGWVAPTVIALLSVALLGTAGLSAYVIYGIEDWRTYAEEVEASLENTRDTAGQDRANLEAAEDRIVTLEEQVANANERITDLANEEANANDSHDILKSYVDAMVVCADERQELIDVLTDSSLYFPGTTNERVERDITDYCASVVEDYEVYLDGAS